MGADRLTLRCWLAILLARLAGACSRAVGYGAGRTLPGRVALTLAPGSLAELARAHRVILISGTNGKTTTTRLVTAALSPTGPVVTNGDGSNLVAGLATALLTTRPGRGSIAVLEVDEIALPAAIIQTEPVLVALLNLSRDQLDRAGEVASHVARWSAALAGREHITVLANSDDPLVVAAVLGARPTANDVIWVSVGQPWRRDFAVCPRCRAAWHPNPIDWACDACGLRRPVSQWSLEQGALTGPDGSSVQLGLTLPGRANAANGAVAVAVAEQFGVGVEAALAQMRTVADVGGRYLVRTLGSHSVRLLLAKNPAGWLEALDELRLADRPVVIAVNAQTADGTDPSWLWDVPMEQLRGRQVVASGERAADLAVRLHYAQVEHTVEADPALALASLPAGPCDLVANYTAFVRARTTLDGGAA